MVGFEWGSLIQDCEDLRIVRVYMCVLWLIDMCKGVKVTVNQGLQNRIKTLKVCECRDANRKTRQSSAEICKSVSFLMALAWKNTTDCVNIYILNQPNEHLLNNIARSVIHISRASMFPRLSRAPYSKSVEFLEKRLFAILCGRRFDRALNYGRHRRVFSKTSGGSIKIELIYSRRVRGADGWIASQGKK